MSHITKSVKNEKGCVERRKFFKIISKKSVSSWILTDLTELTNQIYSKKRRIGIMAHTKNKSYVCLIDEFVLKRLR